jgi:hypothetical protein
MQAHPHEISTAVPAGAHAVVILDQAGWHMSDRLNVPANITLLPLTPRSPELNPQQNIWQFMRGNGLSNRSFAAMTTSLTTVAAPGQAERPVLAHYVNRTSHWAHGF